MTPDTAWSDSQPIQDSSSESCQPAAAICGDALHAVWKDGRTLWHAWLAESGWSAPAKLANGDHPALAVTPDGVLHCLFTNWLLNEDAEIYHARWEGARWSLPEVVSRTTGASIYPAVAADGAGVLHAAWADTTPGRAIIYYGRWEAGVWENAPVPNGPGTLPSIAVTPAGDVYVAWQARLADTNRFNVFCAALAEDRWSLPDNVSDSRLQHGIYPRLAANRAGACHLVWQEERDGGFCIRHADRRPNGWAQPADVSQPGADARGARIAANRLGLMQVVWAEGEALRHRARPGEYDAEWFPEETAGAGCAGPDEIATAITPAGDLHALWCGYAQDSARRIHHLRRERLYKHHVFLPLG